MSCDLVHAIRHRRVLDKPDQYNGLQADLKRDYICYTRGRLKTVMWQEQQPFGFPFAEAWVPENQAGAAADHARKLNRILSQGRWPWFLLQDDWKWENWQYFYQEAFKARCPPKARN